MCGKDEWVGICKCDFVSGHFGPFVVLDIIIISTLVFATEKNAAPFLRRRRRFEFISFRKAVVCVLLLSF
jgi:hypothetical protein